MPYLIDGNNLCGAARDRRLGLPTDEREMADLVERLAAGTGRKCTLVFDGEPAPDRPPESDGLVRVAFSGPGRTADDHLALLARASGDPAGITLVSSDRELRGRFARLGCRVMGCRAFAARIRRDSPASS